MIADIRSDEGAYFAHSFKRRCVELYYSLIKKGEVNLESMIVKNLIANWNYVAAYNDSDLHGFSKPNTVTSYIVQGETMATEFRIL